MIPDLKLMTDLEGQINYLKSVTNLDDDGKDRLKKLEDELKQVNKLKEKYVAAHPDARDRVFHTGKHAPREHNENEGPKPDPMAHLYNPDGTLRDPKKSYYYDPVYNPYGVPPPGMPYRERTPTGMTDPEDSSDDSDEDSDDDIVMPEGPPPEEEPDSDDSDWIPLPDGPPPPSALPAPPPIHMGRGGMRGRGQPRGGPHRGGPPRAGPGRPLPAAPPSLPAKPGTVPVVTAPAVPRVEPKAAVAAAPVAATISAEPQLRDLRKETTQFVPRAARKKAGGVNAAPNAGTVDADGDSVKVRQDQGPGLLGKLKGVGVVRDQAEEDYDKFLEGLDQ